MGLPDNWRRELLHQHKPGPTNQITDVAGVRVGQVTIHDDEAGIHTGVTAVLPHEGNLFRDKVCAAGEVLNGFGKSVGLVQVDELGTIEAPILFTNTLSVGTALTASVRYMLEQDPEIGGKAGTVNCVVTECNDGRLNDIRGLHVTEAHVRAAIDCAATSVEEGAVGAGAGMCCLGFKGGIGTASRTFRLDGRRYTMGALVLTNFGSRGALRIGCRAVGRELASGAPTPDQGSVILLLATDLPLSCRQLRRVCKRAPVALGRVGSCMGNGSGDIAIAFTTANRIPHAPEKAILPMEMLHDAKLDTVFTAAIEALEDAICSSLYHARTVTGGDGLRMQALRELWNP